MTLRTTLLATALSLPLLFLFLFLSLSPQTASAHSPSEWRGRSIYQILTDRFALPNTTVGDGPCTDLSDYCGGTFQGAAGKLDYVRDLGFDAVWISPVVANTEGGYHGYWAQNLSLINSHFGSSDDLKGFVQECHKRDIWVMVDVVANHMGCTECKDDFSSLYPFNQPDHYHPYCIINDFTDQHQVEVCRLAGLPDLAQENDFVRSTLKSWIANLVKEYDFDGVRIDTIPEVSPDFWDEFTAAAGVYTTGEVFNGDLNYVQPYESHVGSVLNYPFYYVLRNVFTKGYGMSTIESEYFKKLSVWKDVDQNPVFVDNHDNERFLHAEGDQTKYKAALTFVLTSTIPIVYYGTEQAYAGGNDPANRESLWPNYGNGQDLYKHIKTLNQLRNVSRSDFTQPFVQRYSDDSFYSFSRGKVLVAATNVQDTQQRTITYHPFQQGDQVCNIFNAGDCLQVGQGGFGVTLSNGETKVYVEKSAASIVQAELTNSDQRRIAVSSMRNNVRSALLPVN